MDPEMNPPEASPAAGKAPEKKSFLSRFSPKQQDFLRGRYAASNAATVLVLVIYALLLLSRLIDAAFLSRESEYLSIILLQLLIFPIPAYLYIKLKPRGFVKALRLGRLKLSHLFLLLSATLMLITGCTLLGMLCGMMTAQPSFTLYDTFASVNDGTVGATVRLILAYGLLPAFCEELIFRGILCAEFEKHGILYASAVSAVFFAFLHFDLTALPVYLFSGMLLALLLYVTRSVIAAMIVHLCYNLFGIFVQAGLSGYCKSTGSVGLLVVLLIALLLLSSAFFCGEVSRILRRRARADLLDDPAEISTPGLNRLPAKKWPRALLSALASPAGIAAVVLWLFGVVVNLVKG
jgi:membrane protease YdiL (CAAX protease family)